MNGKPVRPASALPRSSQVPSAQPRTVSRARPSSALPRASSGGKPIARGEVASLSRPPRASSAAAKRPPVSKGTGGSPASGNQSDLVYFQEELYRLQREQQELKAMEMNEVAAYRRELRRFYNGNAVLRNIIAAAERRGRHDGELSADVSASVTEAEVQHLQYRINLARRRQNRLAHDLKVATSIVDSENSASDEAVSHTQQTHAEMVANRPAFLRRHRLERRLNEILTQQQAIDVVLKGYAHHLNELHSEGLRYDAQMQAVEKELRDRNRDLLQLVTLFRNAKKEFQTSAQACEDFRRQFEAGRAAKDRALRDKRGAVEEQFSATSEQANRLIVLERQIEEEAQLMESAENIEAELDVEHLGHRNALAVLSGGGGGGGRPGTAARGTATVQEEEKLSAYEKLFETLMEKAKVSDPEALIQVFEAELQTQVQMIDEVDTRRAACAQLREEVEFIRAKVDDARLCGLPRQPATTPALEAELQQFGREEKERLMQSVRHQQDTETALSELVRRLGEVAHLMSGYRSDVPIPALTTSKDTAFLLHTAVLTQKVLALADDTVPVRAHPSSALTEASESTTPTTVRSTQLIIPANNTRVPLEAHDHNAIAGGRHGGKRAGSGALRRTSRHASADGGAAAAGISSKVAARLLDTRRASLSGFGGAGAARGSQSFAGEAEQGLSEDYGLVRDGSFSYTRQSSASESSEEDTASGPGVCAPAPSALAPKTASRHSVGAKAKKPIVGATDTTTIAEDDPLRRDEIKSMSEALLRRQRTREEQEQRRQNETGM